MDCSIRRIEKRDTEQLVVLCADHAAYEGSRYSSSDKAASLSKFLFSKTPALECLVVQTGNELVGYATFMKQFSTWEAEFYVYMDCLYLNESVRGRGLGKELINKIAQFGRSENCSHIQWQTPKSNTRAIKFYQEYGATSKEKERFFLNLNK